MLKIKNVLKAFCCLFLILILNFTTNLNYAFANEKEVYLGGFSAGFLLNTTTVQVVGTCDVLTAEGMKSPARDCGIKSGDIIEKINGIDINCTNDVYTAVEEDFKTIIIEITRKNETFTVETCAITELSSGKKRLGLLVKDSVNGIGTVTFIDKSNNIFASLGHPVTDDNNKLQSINGGTIYGCRVYEVKKGVKGTPGELRGLFENDNIIGNVSKNTNCGVFGNVSSDLKLNNLPKINISNIDEVQMGKAYIYSTINGKEIKKYEISIVKVDKENKDNRNFVIKIDDKELISKTGGIVQGMSGSPIVQNDKLIGAVTHVFVNDPTRGYGIAIEKMLNS